MPLRFLASLAIAATAASAVPDAAFAFNGRLGTRIAPVNDTVFEVVAPGAGKGRDYWCGASDYARRVLGADWTDVIYIERGMGPSVTTGRKSAVQFSLAPVQGGSLAISPVTSINELKVGESMTVRDSGGYCNTPTIRS